MSDPAVNAKPSSHEHVVIIGAGAAGLTAGIYTARANLSPLIIAGLQPGGQMTITTDVENYPGFAKVIQGPWLMAEMQAQAENVGARVMYDIVTGLDSTSRPFRLTLDSGQDITADTIILATGAQARWLRLLVLALVLVPVLVLVRVSVLVLS